MANYIENVGVTAVPSAGKLFFFFKLYLLFAFRSLIMFSRFIFIVCGYLFVYSCLFLFVYSFFYLIFLFIIYFSLAKPEVMPYERTLAKRKLDVHTGFKDVGSLATLIHRKKIAFCLFSPFIILFVLCIVFF